MDRALDEGQKHWVGCELSEIKWKRVCVAGGWWGGRGWWWRNSLVRGNGRILATFGKNPQPWMVKVKCPHLMSAGGEWLQAPVPSYFFKSHC